MKALERCPDVRGFFGEHVSAAMHELRVETADETRSYLVNLLSGFSVSSEIPCLTAPLAMLLRRALEASGPERLSRMRELGDVALFICGFFPDSFDRRGLTRTYVVEMGGRAYLVLGQAARSRGARPDVFVELADRFRDMAAVLDEVRERTTLCTDGAVLKLYERWRDTGSPAIARRLQRRGVHPHPRRVGGAN